MQKSAPARITPTCRDCYFHDIKAAPNGDMKLICRKSRPKLAVAWIPTPEGGMGTMSMNIWRTMEPGDWCGEFTVDANGKTLPTTAQRTDA